MAHESVLLKEAIDALDIQTGDVYLDATVGSGGHIEEVWKRKKTTVSLLGIDADETSLSITRERLDLAQAKPKLALLNFRNIDKAEEIFGLKPNKILFDLGWSSDQFLGASNSDFSETAGRGFSFQRDEPLVMTFSKTVKEDEVTAYDVVNSWEEKNLSDVIYGYGEEKFARRIAKAIVEKRKEKPIKTSIQLAEIIKNAVPIFYRFGRLHPATKTFQAIRIAVNDELRALEEGLEKSFSLIPSNGRIAVISFHSLEDRIVKNFFRKIQEDDLGEIINKKPIIPGQDEISKNSRSRSAKLRVIKKK